MPPAITLEQAAGQSFDDLNILWQTGSLKSRLMSFWQDAIPGFPVTNDGGAPIRNWLAVIAAVADNLSLGDIPISDLTIAVKPVYGICWLASYLRSINQITLSQANAILTSYNADLASP